MDVLTGVDPRFAGLPGACERTDDGRLQSATASVFYGIDARTLPERDQRTTVFVPEDEEPWVWLHELGHVLHEKLYFAPVVEACDEYAAMSPNEAFAASFAIRYAPEYPAGSWAREISFGDELMTEILDRAAASDRLDMWMPARRERRYAFWDGYRVRWHTP